MSAAHAAGSLGRANPPIKTAGVADHWTRAGRRGIPRILTDEATANPALLKPGMIFILATGSGKGHRGLVSEVLIAHDMNDALAMLQVVERRSRMCFIGRDNKRPNRKDYIMTYFE